MKNGNLLRADFAKSTVETSIALPTDTFYFGPTIEHWLKNIYDDCYEKARVILESKKHDEYYLTGRAQDKRRNIPRALDKIKRIYLEDGFRFNRGANGFEKDLVMLLLPMVCCASLVETIVDAAGSEWYYKHEKEW